MNVSTLKKNSSSLIPWTIKTHNFYKSAKNWFYRTASPWMGCHKGHMHQRMGRLRGKLKPLSTTLPPCRVVMVSLHERQGLVRWALMEVQARLLIFRTILVMAITPARMATRAINAFTLRVLSPCRKFYIGQLGPKHNIIPLAQLG
jgi:hypothetical protein